MEVKVDPGSETNCIPLSHFRHLFPQLCGKDGKPKDTALEPTLAQFEAYDGGILHAHGWIIMPAQNISNYKFHPLRFYVVEREDAQILINHATVTWLGLVKVLCTDKARKCKRHSKNQLTIILISGPAHPPKVKYLLPGPPHPPKEKYSLTITIRTWKLQEQLRRQLQPATANGGNDIEPRKLTERRTGQLSIQLYHGKTKQQIALPPGRCKVGPACHLQDCHTLPK